MIAETFFAAEWVVVVIGCSRLGNWTQCTLAFSGSVRPNNFVLGLGRESIEYQGTACLHEFASVLTTISMVDRWVWLAPRKRATSSSSSEKCPRLCPWSEGQFSHILLFSTQNGEIRGTVNPCVGGSSPPGGAFFFVSHRLTIAAKPSQIKGLRQRNHQAGQLITRTPTIISNVRRQQ